MCRVLCVMRDVWVWYPGVGWFIAILGALGVATTILRDFTKIGPKEKAVWIIVTVGLLLLELHSISLDRAAHDKEQAEARARETTSFESIATKIEGDIEQSREHFDSTMKKSDKLIALTQEGLNNITGGHSYAYIAAGLGSGPPFQLMVWVKGKYGVHRLAADMQTILNGRDTETIKRQLQSKHSLPWAMVSSFPVPRRLARQLHPVDMQLR